MIRFASVTKNLPAPRSDMPRFVVLHHQVDRGLKRTERCHFDWMFEIDEVLVTWSTEPIEFDSREITVRAERLADHRLAYLDFEGEISGGRGTVSRVVAGTFQFAIPDRAETASDGLCAQLVWSDRDRVSHHRTVRIDRDDESVGSWRLRVSGRR